VTPSAARGQERRVSLRGDRHRQGEIEPAMTPANDAVVRPA
jgi:hypothetical protein